MKNEYLFEITSADIKVGEMELLGGKRVKALNIPGYGWIPCARRLRENWTLDPKELVIVKLEKSDDVRASNIWVSRTTSRPSDLEFSWD